MKNYKKCSLSELILIIKNNQFTKEERKLAEIELKRRLKNWDCEIDELLDMEDSVIKKRGISIDNYLISPNVNMQMLMETFFGYTVGQEFYSDETLLSEKHLCNDKGMCEPFFRKVCEYEIKNIEKRLQSRNENIKEKETLELVRTTLKERLQIEREILKKYLRCKSVYKESDGIYYDPLEPILEANDALSYFMDAGLPTFEIMGNHEFINDGIFDYDVVQDIMGMRFIKKDNSKLKEQRRQLLNQVKNGYHVNYESPIIKKVLYQK